MADDKRNTGSDRQRVAAGQAYELHYFMRKHGLTMAQARDIIKEAGNSREKANALAEERKK